MLCALIRPQPAEAGTAYFSDVPETHPYHIQIETLAQLSIIEGYPDGTFRPGGLVSRQEFAEMVVGAMRIPLTEKEVFAFGEVPLAEPRLLYLDDYSEGSAGRGSISGCVLPSMVRYLAHARFSLAQAATMAARAAGRPLSRPPAAYRSWWGDFDPFHGPVARVAEYNGLLRGLAPAGRDLDSLPPSQPLTRGQAAALLFNLMGTDQSGLSGRFLGDAGDLVRYFRAKAGGDDGRFTVPLETLAQYYITYGERFGLRADMAWAQMIHETGWGRYGGSVAPWQNNMAGIGATGGGVPGNSFATAELGVIAQYAHLAWYVYPGHVSDPCCVKVTQPAVGLIVIPGDPRHFVQADGSPHKGTARTVYELSGTWAMDADYGAALQRLAAGIGTSCGLW